MKMGMMLDLLRAIFSYLLLNTNWGEDLDAIQKSTLNTQGD